MTEPADERPAVDPVQAIADLQRELADVRSTLGAQMLRRPTGDIEPTLRGTAKPDTLLMQGQTVSRATYATLWRWVQDQGLSPSLFGAGDGSTTFVVPDLRGRTVVGADATNVLGAKFGASSVVLTTAHLPQHNHPLTGSINSVGAHDHDVTGAAGNHDAHNYSGTCDPGFGSFPYGHEFLGNHGHPMVWDGAHSHSHSLAVGNTGSASPTPVPVVPAAFAIHWLLWT